ncbi:hypothetical protein V6N11_039753 [Hibiscus sabdariffa]|uniref:Uncharacterized protein n=1 Tax=Hibiscus sabdariffa TaxID=183260 RepID=A0ABR2NFM2_9ROSI
MTIIANGVVDSRAIEVVVREQIVVLAKAIGNNRAETNDQGALRGKTTGQVINHKLSKAMTGIAGSKHSVAICPIDPPTPIGIPQVVSKDTIINIASFLS